MAPILRLAVAGQQPEDVDLSRAVEHVSSGGLLVYPTGTVYGVGCVLRPEPLAELRALKQREEDHPFLVLIGDPAEAEALSWSEESRELASVFWPGSVTLVLADPERRFPSAVRSAAGAVAVRESPHPLVRRLLGELGEPICSTSANSPGEPPARTGSEALECFASSERSRELMVLDAGGLPPSDVSTIVDCTGSPPRVLRSGATPLGRLRCVIPTVAGESPD
jgi:L-threonylcarbamoyladenylate synthase